MSLFHVRRWLTSAALVLGFAPLAGSLGAQGGAISGKVTDQASGAPLSDATVSIAGSQLSASTGADGTYRIANVPGGTFGVQVRRLGYEQQTITGKKSGDVVNFSLVARTVQLEQTVTTASRSRPEKALDAPAKISVISSEQIAERPAVTVTDHLRGVPGIDINRGGLAQSNVVARGFNNAFSGSMLMLQDYRFSGVPSLRVNVPFLFTGTNEDIDRMEVLLGPASALYGPNSSNGVLHVITKSPFSSQGTTISVDGGERSLMRTGIRTAQKLNDKVAYKLSGEYFSARDWEFNDKTEPTTFPTTTNVPESRRGQVNQRDFDLEKMTGEARVDVRPKEGVESITTFGFSKVGKGIELTGANGSAQIKNWTYLSAQQRFRYNRLFAQVFLNSSDAGNKDASDDKGTYLLRSGQPIVDQSRVASAQLQHGFDMMNKKQSFTYGADYIWTNPRTGNTINGQNEDVDNVTEYGAYLQSSTKPNDKLEFLWSARADANNVIKGQFFSPRAAILFKPTKNQNIRATYNRAFSTPANFSFFLDLIQSPNVGGSGFDVRARGNPPKEGFQFNRSCGTGSAFGSYCMKSVYTQNGAFTGASAASAFPGAIQALSSRLTPSIAGALQASAGMPAAQAAAVAAGIVQYLGTRAPTNADLATRVSYISSATTALTTDQVADIAPLSASFNDTYELGWKGLINESKVRYDVAVWRQRRGDVGTSAALSTPNVFFGNPTQLGGYLGTQIATYLITQGGQSPTVAQQLATGLATALTPSVASLPVGVVTFNNGTTLPNAVYATYLTSKGEIWVTGLDLAADASVSDRLTVDAAFSWQNKGVFPGVNGGNGLPLMSNSPRSRGSLGLRWRDEARAMGFELRGRYNEAYPVNSGVYATNFAFPLALGQTGYTVGASGGAGKCPVAPTGTFCYENVPEAVIFDAQVSKTFEIGGKQKLLWSLNAQNMFDNRVRTFPGVAEIGRMLTTRLSYSF